MWTILDIICSSLQFADANLKGLLTCMQKMGKEVNYFVSYLLLFKKIGFSLASAYSLLFTDECFQAHIQCILLAYMEDHIKNINF